jgi:hypothetical protein
MPTMVVRPEVDHLAAARRLDQRVYRERIARMRWTERGTRLPDAPPKPTDIGYEAPR